MFQRICRKLSIIFLFIALLFFYRDEVLWLIRTWTEKGYDSYGYIAFIAFIIYMRNFSMKSSRRTLLLSLIALSCVIAIFIKPGINIISALFFIISLSLVIYYYFSEDIRENPSSILILFLMLPWTHHINIFFGFFLRKLSTSLAAFFLRLGGVSVEVQGTMIFLNQIRLEVGAPCSGSKYLFFTAFFLIVIGLFMKQKVLLLLPIAMITAITCNIFRIISIAYLRIFLQGEESIVFHNIIGIFYFIIALIGVYFLWKKTSSWKFHWLFFL